MKNLLKDFTDFVIASSNNDWEDNYDIDRFGKKIANEKIQIGINESFINYLKNKKIRYSKEYLKKIIFFLLKKIFPNYFIKQSALKWLKPNVEELQWLSTKLSDPESKNLLINLLAYRMLGHRKVKLPLNTPFFWSKRHNAKKLRNINDFLPSGCEGFTLYKTDLFPLGYPFELYVLGVDCQFIFQQYRYHTDHKKIDLNSGDVVIDAGGCHGDTAFYFAEKVGIGGHIYSFEFLKDNLKIFELNLENNPSYKKIISIVKKPLWSESKKILFIDANGPATRVLEESVNEKSIPISTISIDDFVNQNNICRLNFIKMDIEGSEIFALKGAENSIRKFKPTLAISVYHRFSDFWAIPKWIDNLNLGYKFYLGHYTIHAEETVLYAEVS